MEKSIGILGGMGPLATADLLRKIVLLTKAEKDGDHVRVFIDDNPRIPDRTAAILTGGENPLPQMTDSLEKLEKCGASCIRSSACRRSWIAARCLSSVMTSTEWESAATRSVIWNTCWVMRLQRVRTPSWSPVRRSQTCAPSAQPRAAGWDCGA